MPWRRILFWLAALGCALAVLWWGGNVLLSRQVEQRLGQWLDDQGMPAAVQWQRLHATLWGRVSMQGVRLEHKGLILRADALHLHGLRYGAVPSRVRLVVEGLSRQDGHSPLAWLDGPWQGNPLPPLTLEVGLEHRQPPEGAEQLGVQLRIQQPQAFEWQGSAHWQNWRNAQNFLRTLDWSRFMADAEEREHLWNSAAFWLVLGQLTLADMLWSLQDRGMVAQWQTSDAATAADWPDWLRDCTTVAPLWHTQADALAACRTWQAFVRGEHAQLRWQARPARPVALLLLWQAYSLQPARLATLLDARWSAQ